MLAQTATCTHPHVGMLTPHRAPSNSMHFCIFILGKDVIRFIGMVGSEKMADLSTSRTNSDLWIVRH